MGPERVETVWDSELDALPEKRALAVLGWRNRYTPELEKQLARHPLEFSADTIAQILSHPVICLISLVSA